MIEWVCPKEIINLALNENVQYQTKSGELLANVTESPKEWVYLREESVQLEDSVLYLQDPKIKQD